MPEIVIKETRILAEDEIIDISVTRVPVSSDIPHGIGTVLIIVSE